MEKFRTFYNNKTALNAVIHCLTLVIFISMIQYPLAYKTILLATKTCRDKLTNILLLGAITNSTYLLGSIIYKLFIVNQSPEKFYSRTHLLGLIFLLALTIVIYFDINKILSLILVSLLQVYHII